MDRDGLISAVCGATAEARGNGVHFTRIDVENTAVTGENQFLFFLKPELTEATESLGDIMGYLLGTMADHGMAIESAAAISGEYLAKHGIVSEHYGIIDAAAKDPSSTITEAMRRVFEENFGLNSNDATLIGGVPYLQVHPELDSATLSNLWLERGYVRIGSGTYCQYVPEEDLYLVNGFYPRMLEHFTKERSCIVTFVLRSSTSWGVARGDFVGATAPAEAKAGSVRKGLLERQTDFKLGVVSPNLNGVHLSAGPVEGLVELMRFTQNREEPAARRDLTGFMFGKLLSEQFDANMIEEILGNCEVETESGVSTTFDITEELDSDDALLILRSTLDKKSRTPGGN
jgi:hypothetical protein